MSRIKGKNTKPEILVRRYLYKNGFRGYRIHFKDLPGKPDIVFPKLKTIIDIRGCFWHGHKGCKWGSLVISNSEQIMNRVKSAVLRDVSNEKKWQNLGWRFFIIWDSCQLEAKKKNSLKREKYLRNLLIQLEQIRSDLLDIK